MEIQSSYFSYLFALGIGQSLFLIYALIKSGVTKNLSRIYFAFLLGIFTLEIIFGFLYQTGSILDFPHLLRVNTPFVLAIGPLILLTFRHILDKDRRFKRIDLWHFLPFAFSLIYFIPVYLQTASFKLDYINVMFQGVHRDSLIFGGFRRIQQPAYILTALLLIRQSDRDLKELLKHKFFRVLFALTLLFAFMWVFDVYRFFFDFQLYTGIINNILMSSVLIYLTLKLVSKETFFQDDLKMKYSSSGLNQDGEVALMKRIAELLEQERIFTDTSLKVSAMGDLLGVPPNYISQTINNQEGSSFSDYINQWRVETAKGLLQNPSNHNLTLLFIAEQSGFKSSSAFNAAFKKFTNITPSQYRKQYG